MRQKTNLAFRRVNNKAVLIIVCIVLYKTHTVRKLLYIKALIIKLENMLTTSTKRLFSHKLTEVCRSTIASIKEAGTYKVERVITSSQSSEITVQGGQKVLNFCANNYLGLSDHPRIRARAKKAIDTHGFGMSSVRFICGT